MIVYADALFFMNCALTGLILVVTAWAARRKVNWQRTTAAAVLASLYALGEIWPEFRLFYSPLFKFIFSCFWVVAAFPVQSWKEWIPLVALFYLISFVFGGAVVGWLYFFEMDQGSLAAVIGGVTLSVVLFWFGLDWLQRQVRRRRFLQAVEIAFLGEKQTFMGLMDTGNGLYSLWSGKPVVIVELEAVLAMLPLNMQKWLQHSGEISTLSNYAAELWVKRLERVPFRGLGHSTEQWLWAFRPDAIRLPNSLGFRPRDCLIGLLPVALARDGSYQVLLHPDLMQRE